MGWKYYITICCLALQYRVSIHPVRITMFLTHREHAAPHTVMENQKHCFGSTFYQTNAPAVGQPHQIK